MKSSSATTSLMEDEARDNSCYFPGCKKDANCNCNICLASFNATLDLMSLNIQKSSLTKFSSSKTFVEKTPISFDSSIMSTPVSNPTPAQITERRKKILETPILRSTARARLNREKVEQNKEREKDRFGVYWKLMLGFSLIFVMEIGFSCWVKNGGLKPELRPELVRSIGERSLVGNSDLNLRLRFLQRELQGLVEGKVSNCSCIDSPWKITQDGLLLKSRCTLYKSFVEEVSIWGWPLQTAGLLKSGFSSWSLTILSGRVTEWPEGKVGFLIRKTNSSWVIEKFGASVVQLDPNTWVLEYQRNFIQENRRLFSILLEFFKHMLQRKAGRIKQVFQFGNKHSNAIPT